MVVASATDFVATVWFVVATVWFVVATVVAGYLSSIWSDPRCCEAVLVKLFSSGIVKHLNQKMRN